MVDRGRAGPGGTRPSAGWVAGGRWKLRLPWVADLSGLHGGCTHPKVHAVVGSQLAVSWAGPQRWAVGRR